MKIGPETILDETVDIQDARFDELDFYILKVSHSAPHTLVDGQYSMANGQWLHWHAEADEIRPVPDSAEAALLPEQVKTNEQLYLTGLHLEQYRHATWLPTDYYEEALRRDPNDIRCLNALGLWYIRKGRFAKAEGYLRKAVKLSQKRNPNPYDSEPIFNLALALKYQGKNDEAYEFFWKATWSKAWADAGYFEAAKISVAQGRFEDALDEIDRCLYNNWHNHKARALKATVLRKQQEGKQKGGLQMGSSKDLNDRLALIKESLKLDRFNYGILYEQYLLSKDKDVLKQMVEMMHGNVYNYHELALDYAQAGLWQEAEEVLTIPSVAKKLKKDSPLTLYYLGYFKLHQGDAVEANACFEQAEKQAADYCFPNRLEDIQVLEMAKVVNPDGAKAPYYLGCLYYAARQYDIAIENWERSAQLDPSFPTVWRNLALGRFNKQDRQEEALACMEKAFELDKNDERVFMELDQLYKRLHRPHQERLAFLQKYPKLIQRRDDLVLEEITLLNQTGHYEEAMQKLDAHTFHPWEGGEGKVSAQYQICRVELAKQAIVGKEYEKAVRLLSECLDYPHHLGEGKLYGAQENDFYYLLGVAYDALGEKEKAMECWEKATKGPQEPAAAMYYNDAKPDKIFYQGLALYKLGREGEAHGRFYRLINYGKQHIFEKQVMDYFAVSLPDLLIWEDSLDAKNLIHCKYMLALGYYGMGDMEHALRYLGEVEGLDNNHQGIQQLRTLIDLKL